jgi:galactose mutarotase-like enzyme
MKPVISRTTHKNIDAIRMESPDIVVTMIPESGAKIQSIFDKRAKKEILFQSDRPEFRRASYGDRFPQGDMSGIDEVFPTIDECFYPSGPWKGTWIPDHGEVWALPWDCRIEDDRIRFAVHGIKFPYRMEKTVEFIREDCFHMSYRVENLSCFDLYSIWCPHPFFKVEEPATHVILPPSVKQVISTCPLENKLGNYGSIHHWPVTQLEDGSVYDISDVMDPPYAEKCEKFYAMQIPDEGWCALHNSNTGYTVGLSYPVEKLPYLGVWEGLIDGTNVTALEPVTGAMDLLNIAMLAGKAGLIPAGSCVEWYLNITLGITESILRITNDGLIITA